MAMYLGGASEPMSFSILHVDFDSAGDSPEYVVRAVDEQKYEIVTRRKRLPLVSRGIDEVVVTWSGADHRIARTNKDSIDEKGRIRDLARVMGFVPDEGGIPFIRCYDDELQGHIEHLEFYATVRQREKRGLPLGMHLEPRFQRQYYGIDGAKYVLGLILGFA
jgi:hypothetical protein